MYTGKKLSSFRASETYTCIKAGLGLRYLCDKYDCMEEQILNRIKKFYKKSPHTAKKLICDLRANDKILEAKQIVEAEASREAAEAGTVTDQFGEMDFPSIKVEETHSEETELENSVATIAEVGQAIEKQEEIVVSLELQRKALRSEQRKRNDALRRVLTELDELEKAALAKGEEYDRILAENRESEKKVKEISARFRSERTKLDAMQAELNALSRVEIYVYDDETISVSDESLELDDSGYEELADELFTKLARRS